MLDQRHIWKFFDTPDAKARLNQYKITGDCYPLHVVLQPTAHCRHACDFCYHRNALLTRRNALTSYEFPVAKLISLISELEGLGVRQFIISGGGEPLLYSGIREIVSAVNATKAESYIYSSLDFSINDELANELGRFGGIGVNINAHNAESYSARRGETADFKLVCKNIKTLVAIGAKLYGTIITRGDDDVAEVVEFCLDNGMCGVNISPPFNSVADVKILERLKSKFNGMPVRVVSAPEGMANYRGYKYCHSHRFDVTIGADQGVYPCCSTAYHEEFMIANMRDFGSFAEMCSSEQRRNWMEVFKPPCDNCWFYPVNRRLASELI